MNTASIANRASVIRQDIHRLTDADRSLIYRYSMTATRWEALRLLIDQGKSTPADDRRFSELSAILWDLTERLGLEVATEERCAPDAVVGITVPWGGFIPGDCSYLISGETWQTAASGW